MKRLKFILVLCVCIFCFSAQAFGAAISSEKQEIIKEYYFTEAVNIAAGLCIGIYDPQQAPEIAYLRDYGWEIVPFKLKDGKVDSSIVVAKNHIKEQDIDFYIVGFRGSANKSDWKINLETEQVPYGGSTVEEFKTFAQTVKADETVPMVHKGFNEYVNTVLSATMQDGSSSKRFVEEIKNNPKVRVLLTGHSLGGAVATLTAERLVSMGIEKWRVPVITFGAPAIGNAAFAKAYGDKILLWRITNTADPVPGSLQTFFGGYKQFGRQYKYSVSPKLATQQHDMAMYFDVSVHKYYKALQKAQDAADELLDASDKDAFGMLIQDAVDHIDEKQEEEKEKAEEAQEKRDEQQEKIDEKKEEKQQQEKMIEGSVEADRLEADVTVNQTGTSKLEEAQQHIQTILKKNNLVNEDLKGIKIDLNF